MKKTKELILEDYIKKCDFSKFIAINIENLTDKKINYVDIINFDYKDRDDLKYSLEFDSYSVLLRHLYTEKVSVIAMLKYYENSNEEQEKAQIKLLYFDAFGRSASVLFSDCVLFGGIDYKTNTKNVKVVENIIQRYGIKSPNKEKKIKLSESPLLTLNPLTKLELEYLMPKTTAKFTFFCK